MVRIVIEISSALHLRKEVRQFDCDEVHIGRGYHNDVIVQDPYVSADHLVIRRTDDGWMVEDVQSRNGIFLYRKQGRLRNRMRLNSPHTLRSGEVFFIGNTVLRIFLPHHKVSPAKRLETRGHFFQSINNARNTLYAVVGFFLLYYIDIALSHPYVEVSNGQIIFVELMVFIGIMVWAGFWSLVGRVIRHRARFSLHVSMAAFFLIVMLPLINTAQFLGFIFASSMAEGLVLMAGGGVLFTILLVSHEAIATFLSLRSRIIFSALVPIAIYALSGIGYVALQAEFQPRPDHYVRLNPPIIKPVFVKSAEDFLKEIPGVLKRDE